MTKATCFTAGPRPTGPGHHPDTKWVDTPLRYTVGHCGALTQFVTAAPRHVTCPGCHTLLRHRAELKTVYAEVIEENQQ